MFNYFLSINVTNVYLIIITILFFFCLIIYKKYKILKKRFLELERNNLYINSFANENYNNSDLKDVVSINDISSDNIDNFVYGDLEDKNNKSSKVDVCMDSLNKKNNNDNKMISSIDLDDANFLFDINDFVKDGVRKIKEEKKSCVSYLDEVSFNLSNGKEIGTIELTDYEKNQEENAIISYKELLKVKNDDKSIDSICDDTINFIEELKAFRNSLN